MNIATASRPSATDLVPPLDTRAELVPVESSPRASEDRRAPIKNSPYPEICKTVLLAFVDLMESRGWSQAEAAKKIKHGPRKNAISGGALSQLLTGTYKADPVALCASIDRLINLESGRALFEVGSFVKTRLYKVFEQLADTAVITRGIACAHGGLLAGKTTNAIALSHLYDRATPVFVTVPYADSYRGFIRRLATVRHVAFHGPLSDVRERILSAFDETHLLIIDEFHQPVTHYSWSQAVRVYEFIREINDTCRCGILLVGQSAGWHTITTNDAFERLAATILSKDITNTIPTRGNDAEDLRSIAATFGLPAPTERDREFCKDVVAATSIGRFFDLLRLAGVRAKRLRQDLDWQHLREVHTNLLKLN